MVVYYFTPDYEDSLKVMFYTREECEKAYMSSSFVRKHSIVSFEHAFNNDCISDLGLIRIFEQHE